jgi:hypothetical protein
MESVVAQQDKAQALMAENKPTASKHRGRLRENRWKHVIYYTSI